MRSVVRKTLPPHARSPALRTLPRWQANQDDARRYGVPASLLSARARLLRFLFGWWRRRRTTHAVVMHHAGTHHSPLPYLATPGDPDYLLQSNACNQSVITTRSRLSKGYREWSRKMQCKDAARSTTPLGNLVLSGLWIAGLSGRNEANEAGSQNRSLGQRQRAPISVPLSSP